MDRRTFLAASAAGIATSTCGWGANKRCDHLSTRSGATIESESRPPQFVHSIVPVIGDGKWIWTEPPEDQTGYLEPRDFSVTVGMTLTGRGDATDILATTVAPIESDEQKQVDVQVRQSGCEAQLRKLADGSGQLILAANGIRRGQTIQATAEFQLQLHKDYRGFERDSFPTEQLFTRPFMQAYATDSPGIQVRHSSVRRLANEIALQLEHPWDKAQAFHQWVRDNIEPREQAYTSVTRAIRDRVGDCEECAAVFVALCRASGIPARLVWVPGHNWAEFCLHDAEDQVHWIPAHTAAYSWFGWTGAHEVILQKGDRVWIPEKEDNERLVVDWLQWAGRKPDIVWSAEIAPMSVETGSDPGPGARSKDEIGRWKPSGEYSEQAYVRR